MTKIVDIPKNRMNLLGDNGQPGATVRVFDRLLGLVIESKSHKSDPDAYLAHDIKEKLDMLEKNKNIESVDFTEAEIAFIEEGIEELRKAGRIAGSSWYYLIDALKNARNKEEKVVKP